MTSVQRFFPVIATAVSGLAMFFSMGLAGSVAPGLSFLWMVALLAPVLVLRFGFRAEKDWGAFVAAFAAAAIGASNILPAYFGSLPPLVLVLAITVPSLGFAVAVVGARFIARRIAPVSGVIAFACLWTGIDYVLSLGPNGTASSPAYAQVEAPWMIQIASVFGLWGVTFTIALFAAALAMFAVSRQRVFALLAAGVLALNLGYGFYRIETAPVTQTIRVGLAADDDLIGLRFKEDAASALTVVKAYAAAGKSLAAQNATLIVFPERVAVLKPQWRAAVNSELQTLARNGHAMVVIGFDARETPRRNVAYSYFASGTEPLVYAKRHLVPGLESVFTPGDHSFMAVAGRIGVAICKDMDFPATLRGDAIVEPAVYAVPAWDFDKDGAWHARLAILRGVENGFAVARAANGGMLSISDAYGRVIAAKPTSSGGMVSVRADVARGPGSTLYGRIGDGLAIIAIGLSLLLLIVAALADSKRAMDTP